MENEVNLTARARFNNWLENRRHTQLVRSIKIPPDINAEEQHLGIPLEEMIQILEEANVNDRSEPKDERGISIENSGSVFDTLREKQATIVDLHEYMIHLVAIREFSYFSSTLNQLDIPFDQWEEVIITDIRRQRDWWSEARYATELLNKLKNRSWYPGDEIRAEALPASKGYRIAVRREQSLYEQWLGSEDEVIYHIPSSSCSTLIRIAEPISYWFRTDNPSKLLRAIEEAGNVQNVTSWDNDGNAIKTAIHHAFKGSKPEWAVAAALGLMSSERNRFPIPQRILDNL